MKDKTRIKKKFHFAPADPGRHGPILYAAADIRHWPKREREWLLTRPGCKSAFVSYDPFVFEGRATSFFEAVISRVVERGGGEVRPETDFVETTPVEVQCALSDPPADVGVVCGGDVSLCLGNNTVAAAETPEVIKPTHRPESKNLEIDAIELNL